MFTPGIPEDDRAERRLADIREAISGRLTNVTASMSDESREELLTQMALLQWNAERRAVVRNAKWRPIEPVVAEPTLDETDPPDLGPITDIE